MAGFLLDTSVLSEIRKGPRADRNVAIWFASVPGEHLYISVLAVGEIRKGIELARGRDPGKAAALERWLASLDIIYADRRLPISQIVADEWGRLGAFRPLPAIDGLLAATALTHSLTLVTRNTADVTHTGVPLLNPFLPRQSH